MEQRLDWQVNGNAANAYQSYIGRVIMLPWAQDLVEATGLGEGHCVLDVGCGTGIVARLAARAVGSEGRVVGLDMNEWMLAVARSIDEPGAGAPIEWKRSDVCAMPLPDSQFDAALCQQALQFFADKGRALKEVRRVLKPGGRLALNVFRSLGHCPWHSAVANALERHVSLDVASVIRGTFSLSDAEELRSLILKAGFTDVHVRIESKMMRHRSVAEFLPGYLASTPIAEAVARLDDKVHSSILEDVTTALHEHIDDDGLAVPVQCHVVTARKQPIFCLT